jgi:hypothetical protein
MVKFWSSLSLLFFLYAWSAGAQGLQVREKILLEGTWKFRLDPSGTGLKENWQDSIFIRDVQLPGSLEENGLGQRVEQPLPSRLNQTRTYVGAAWYQKEITIPSSWKGKHIELFLERTKATQVWINGRLAGTSSLLSAPHIFDLTNELTPGKHLLTIWVDNSPALFPVGGSHALSEHTQTNWNGIIGRMYIEASGRLKIGWIKVTPDIRDKTAKVRFSLQNGYPERRTVELNLEASATNSPWEQILPAKQYKIDLDPGDTIVELIYPMGDQAQLWSEHSPVLYRLTTGLYSQEGTADSCGVTFGMREFKPLGTQLAINGEVTFLRGKNDGCIFPLTGYPPMDTRSWQELFRKAKSYGINHYRFHSWTPPEAAFEAADLEGIYIQAELPCWANLAVADTFKTTFQYREGLAILDVYGNHPSFVMFTLGNELAGDSAVHNSLVIRLRKHDPRRLYAHGSNAFYADPRPGATDDFWVTMRTGGESANGEFDVRGSFATTEDKGNGMINSSVPNTRRNFSSAIQQVRLPVIGHETGQYQLYPDYSEIPEYTGVLRPLNLEIFRKRLQDTGMGDQAEDFFRASGQLSALLYREEIEMALRTPGLAGFQLLDLQDYPGQGTALVGLLNAFMENKGLVTDEEFRRFCNDMVIQLLSDRYTWSTNETFTGDVQIVNYGRQDLKEKQVIWTVRESSGNRTLASGSLQVPIAEKGKITAAGKISFLLSRLTRAEKLLIRLEMPEAGLQIEYPAWVYPEKISLKPPKGITVTNNLDNRVLHLLEEGGKVLFFPDHEQVKDQTVGPQFISEFWNWLVFKKAAENMKRPVSAGTLGILTNPQHPIFRFFPTDFHTNWQWWPITKHTRPLIFDSIDKQYKPVVQVIDNIDRNHKLGMIFEFKVRKGKLLVCMAALPDLQDRPEVKQLYHSMLRYMDSKAFNPLTEITTGELEGLFNLNQTNQQ